MDHSVPDTKTRILEAAKKLFAYYGFDATSVRQICEEAGVNIALVSYYFGGKEKVFHALFDHFFPSYLLSENRDILNDPVEGIRFIIREVIHFRRNNPEMAMIIQREIAAQSPRSIELRKYIFPVWNTIKELLEKGRKQGVYHFEHLDQVLMFIIGILVFPRMSSFIEPLLSDVSIPAEEIVNETEQFIFRGLGYAL